MGRAPTVSTFKRPCVSKKHLGLQILGDGWVFAGEGKEKEGEGSKVNLKRIGGKGIICNTSLGGGKLNAQGKTTLDGKKNCWQLESVGVGGAKNGKGKKKEGALLPFKRRRLLSPGLYDIRGVHHQGKGHKREGTEDQRCTRKRKRANT